MIEKARKRNNKYCYKSTRMRCFKSTKSLTGEGGSSRTSPPPKKRFSCCVCNYNTTASTTRSSSTLRMQRAYQESIQRSNNTNITSSHIVDKSPLTRTYLKEQASKSAPMQNEPTSQRTPLPRNPSHSAAHSPRQTTHLSRDPRVTAERMEMDRSTCDDRFYPAMPSSPTARSLQNNQLHQCPPVPTQTSKSTFETAIAPQRPQTNIDVYFPNTTRLLSSSVASYRDQEVVDLEARTREELKAWLDSHRLGHQFELLVQNELESMQCLKTAPQAVLDRAMGSMKPITLKMFDKAVKSLRGGEENGGGESNSLQPIAHTEATVDGKDHEVSDLETRTREELKAWLDSHRLGHQFELLVQNDLESVQCLKTAPQAVLDRAMGSMKPIPLKMFCKAVKSLRGGEENGGGESNSLQPIAHTEATVDDKTKEQQQTFLFPGVDDEDIPENAKPLREAERVLAVEDLQNEAENEIAVIQHILSQSRRQSRCFSESALKILEDSKDQHLERAKRLKSMCKQLKEARKPHGHELSSTKPFRRSFESGRRVCISNEMHVFCDGNRIQESHYGGTVLAPQTSELAQRSIQEENEFRRIMNFDEEKRAKEISKLNNGGWKCGTCQSVNDRTATLCSVCCTPKPFQIFEYCLETAASYVNTATRWVSDSWSYGDNGTAVSAATSTTTTRAGTPRQDRDTRTGTDHHIDPRYNTGVVVNSITPAPPRTST